MDCQFCNIIKKQTDKIFDFVLYEDEYFVITPTLGSIMPGYILIISKIHVSSMMQLDSKIISYLNTLINSISDLYFIKYGFYPFIFEHGTLDVTLTASSVMHAHLHILPYQMSNNTGLDTPYCFKTNKRIVDLKNDIAYKSYLIYIDNNKYLFYYSLEKEAKIESQYFRKMIANDLGIKDYWDWKKEAFIENIRSTILEIGPILNKLGTHIHRKIKNVYYSRAVDGFQHDIIKESYKNIGNILKNNNLVLLNNIHAFFSNSQNQRKPLLEIVHQNMQILEKADCAIIDLSIKDHLYIGCIDEMVCAHQSYIYVIVICGNSGAENRLYVKHRANKIVNDINEAIDFINTLNLEKHENL